MPERARPYLVILIAVLAMSWAAPLVRLTDSPPITVAAWRVAIATVLLIPLMLAGPWRLEWAGLTRPEVWLVVLCGAVLALHFASWIASLRLTSVAAASVLVSLSPVFAWLFSARLLGERPAARQLGGMALAIGGAAVIAATDVRGGGSDAVLGDALALLGAVCGGAYFVIGRRLRSRLSVGAYVVPVYACCAAVLLAWAAMRGELLAADDGSDWAVFAALAVGPMVIGHTGFNYALRYLSAWRVNVAALGEPVGAILLAWTLPAIAEPPGLAVAAGGAVALAGIAIALTGAPSTRES